MSLCKSWVVVGLVVGGLCLAGCGGSSTSDSSAGDGPPAKLEPITGTPLSRVTLSTDGARRIGTATGTVAAAIPPADAPTPGPRISVPLAALIFDKDGATWVYTTTQAQALTYRREAVTVARVEGTTALLASGPAVGTVVVTVGGAELLGAELGVAGE